MIKDIKIGKKFALLLTVIVLSTIILLASSYTIKSPPISISKVCSGNGFDVYSLDGIFIVKSTDGKPVGITR